MGARISAMRLGVALEPVEIEADTDAVTGAAFGRYLAEYAFAYVSMYAGLASAMVALVFLYVCASIFIFGGELNSAIAKVRERP